MSSIAFKKAIKKSKKEIEKHDELPVSAFEQTALDKSWIQYAEQLKQNGKNNLASIFTMQHPQLEEDFQITFAVANEMNRVEMMRELEFFLPFLHKNLNNHAVKIQLKVSESLQTEAFVTPQEKYAYLLKINPELETLRNTFDLDF